MLVFFFSHAKGRLAECDADQLTLTKRLAGGVIRTPLPTALLDRRSSLSGMRIAFILVFDCKLFL